MTSDTPSLVASRASDISTTELKNLLVILSGNPIQLRFRLMGAMWQQSFMRVVSVTNDEVVFRDDVNRKIVILSDLKMIAHFELDGSLLSLLPNFHYDVVASHLHGK